MDEIRVNDRWKNIEADNWSKNGNNFGTVENLKRVQDELERGVIIVEHWFYRGSSSPDRFFFEEYDEFELYLKTKTFAGDIINVWSFTDLCKKESRLASGKMANLDGCVPEKGAY